MTINLSFPDFIENNRNNLVLFYKLILIKTLLESTKLKFKTISHFGINNRLINSILNNYEKFPRSVWTSTKDSNSDLMFVGNEVNLKEQKTATEIFYDILSLHNDIVVIVNDDIIDCFSDIKNDKYNIFYFRVFIDNTISGAFSIKVNNQSYYNFFMNNADTIDLYDNSHSIRCECLNDLSKLPPLKDEYSYYYKARTRLINYVDLLTNEPYVTGPLKIVNSNAVELFKKLYNSDDASQDKIDFFKKIKQAKGLLKYNQRINFFLLKKLKQFSDILGIKFWLYGGTLLGAVRHGGFIPWDDDIDIGIKRNDLNRLIKYLKNNDSFQIRILYNTNWGDRIYKFEFKDTTLFGFVDIFPYDNFENYSGDTWKKWLQIKHKMICEFREFQKTNNISYISRYEIKPEHLFELNNLYNKYICIAEKEFKTNISSSNKMIVGIDNPSASPNFKAIFIDNDLFPLKLIKFEKYDFYCPNKYDVFLNNLYKNPFTLPEDIISHRHTRRLTDIEFSQINEKITKLEKIKFRRILSFLYKIRSAIDILIHANH